VPGSTPPPAPGVYECEWFSPFRDTPLVTENYHDDRGWRYSPWTAREKALDVAELEIKAEEPLRYRPLT